MERNKILLLLVTMLLLMLVPSVAQAQTTSINTNVQVTGNISGSGDIDYYNFTIPAAGKVSVNFQHDILTDYCFWSIYILDSQNNTKTDFTNYYNNPNQTSWSVRLPAGSYSVKITGSGTSYGLNYKVTANYTSEGQYYEKEPNDLPGTAYQISSNTAYIGNMENTGDSDYYKIVLPSAGKVSVNFQHSILADYCWWDVYILDSQNNNKTNFTNYYNEPNETSWSVRLPAGTYYIRIKSGSSADSVNSDYQITVNYTSEGQYYEKEPNELPGTAYQVSLNTSYTGNIESTGDNDYYKIVLPSAGKVSANFQHAILADYCWWDIFILDSQNNTKTDFTNYYNEPNETSWSVRLPAGTYYIRIKSGSSAGSVNSDYQMTVNYAAEGQYYEKEPNELAASANSINLNTEYTGNIESTKDDDYYKIVLPSADQVSVNFQHAILTDYCWWNVYILDSQNNTKTNFTSYYDQPNLTSAEVNLAAGTYYIRIYSGSSAASVNSEYKLKVNSKYAPIDTQAIQTFVTRFYQLCLLRTPDAGGLSYWVDQLAAGQKTGADVAQNFVFSNEFIIRNVSDSDFLDIMYSAFFDRAADPGGKAYWLGQMSTGMSRMVMLANFVNSDEFATVCARYGINRGSIDQVNIFVSRFYLLCLEREPDVGGLSYWSNQLLTGQNSGADLSRGFVFSPEFVAQALNNADFLDVMYRAFFDREPDSGGLAYWQGQMTGGMSRLAVLANFVNSAEFAAICSDYGIEPGVITY